MTTYRRLIRNFLGIALGFLAAAAPLSPPWSPASPAEEKPVTLLTAWSVDRVRPGDSAVLAVVITIEEGYHVIADAAQVGQIAGFKPFPTAVQATAAPAGITAESPRYPPAKVLTADFVEGGIASFDGRTIVHVPIRVDANFLPGEASFKVEVQFQVCSASTCLMPRKEVLETRLAVVSPNEKTTAINPELFETFSRESAGRGDQKVRLDLFGMGFTLDAASYWGWLLLILAAGGGGFLLNFTPCVLPLIPIKVISMSNAAANRHHCLALGVATFCGVLAFWMGLGGIISIVSGFTSTNQLYQYPLFTIVVGVVIAAMAAGMLAGYAIRLPGFLYALNPGRETLWGAFGVGVLTAVLSTPCTAPFMGAAAAWAATQAPTATVSTFLAIGAGMGLPYLLLAAAPRLLGRLPKTGPASLLLKQTMGLFMLAAAAYFIGIGLSTLASDSATPSRLYWWPVMAVCATAGAWTGYRAFGLVRSKPAKAIWLAVGAFILIFSVIGGTKLTSTGPIRWVAYTPERLTAAFKEQKTVVMIFTAEWCLNCKALEQAVWNNHELADLVSRPMVAPMKVDLTGSNPLGREKLRQAGSLTIPLLVVYAADGRPILKSDFYTVEQVMEAIQDAQRSQMKGHNG